jgi:putative restriction endonuclease
MMHYWWVNHNQTASQEIDGQFLWSPKTEKGGTRSQFYDNMRIAGPGDLVLSFARSEIGFVGTVLDFALTAKKPEEFGAAGRSWDTDGWYLPVTWRPIRKPTRPADIIDEIRPLLPDKYSPIRPLTGRGNQKAYLSQINQALFERMVALEGRRSNLPFESADADAKPPFYAIVERLDESEEARIKSDPSLGQTEKSQLIMARRGQGDFRKSVIQTERGCRVTGLDNPALLVASHIKPWRSCTSDLERLDGSNGLLLAAHVDLLFDRGFVSFCDNGDVLLSPRLNLVDLTKLGLQELIKRNTGKFLPKQMLYMEFHRAAVFLQ